MTTISLTRTLTASAILISAALLPVHATAGDALSADLGKYPGSTLAAPTGHVSVKFHQNKLSVAYDLEKTTPSSSGGVHIHTGSTCSVAEKVGGHYWSPDLGEDTWKKATWNSDKQGKATGELTIQTGYDYAQNLSHALVIHDSEGRRIACGLLGVAPNSGY